MKKKEKNLGDAQAACTAACKADTGEKGQNCTSGKALTCCVQNCMSCVNSEGCSVSHCTTASSVQTSCSEWGPTYVGGPNVCQSISTWYCQDRKAVSGFTIHILKRWVHVCHLAIFASLVLFSFGEAFRVDALFIACGLLRLNAGQYKNR